MKSYYPFIKKKLFNGEMALFSQKSFQVGDVLYELNGKVLPYRTRESIEISHDCHIHDPVCEFINHSFFPNIKIQNKKIVAIANIAKNDEVKFDYTGNESEIAHPFLCHETGKPVNSSVCKKIEYSN